jgi:hypothetical protein
VSHIWSPYIKVSRHIHGVDTQQRQSDKYHVTPTYKSASFGWDTVYPGARIITYVPSTTIRPCDFYGDYLEYVVVLKPSVAFLETIFSRGDTTTTSYSTTS